VYDKLPNALLTQIVHIWHDVIGENMHIRSVQELYEDIASILRREYGVFRLPGTERHSNTHAIYELENFFLNETNIDRVLDVVEITFKAIDSITRDVGYQGYSNASKLADSAISELNTRFKEHAVGFQYSNGEIVRVDSALIHAEVVKPALRLLNGPKFVGAQEEFLKAYEHYRHGNEKEALNECLKAFESMMKGICDKRGWTYKANGTAKDLIETCLSKGLIPPFWQQSFTALRSLLESSIPTGRNKLGGHGQGAVATTVPPYLVGYMLHMTASALVFLGEAEAALP
jgi:hypothetical protein